VHVGAIAQMEVGHLQWFLQCNAQYDQ
jgi:hypothetical protein